MRDKLEQKIALLKYIRSFPCISQTRAIFACGLHHTKGRKQLNDLEEQGHIKRVPPPTRKYHNARYFEITLSGRVTLAESERLHKKLKVHCNH